MLASVATSNKIINKTHENAMHVKDTPERLTAVSLTTREGNRALCLHDGRRCSGLGAERRPVRAMLKGSRVQSTFASLSEERDKRNPVGTVSIIILCRLFDFKEMDAFFFFFFLSFFFSLLRLRCVLLTVVFGGVKVEDG